MCKVSIIVCHFQGDLVDKCLKSIRGLEEQVILASSLRRKDIGVLNLYIARNEPTFKRNYAVHYAEGEYICFLDDDVEVDPNCVSVMSKYLEEHPDVGMVYALLYQDKERKIVDTAGSWLSKTGFLVENYIVPMAPVNILSAKSACCMIRTNLFRKLNGFDEDFVIYGEETDLSWRVWHTGNRVMLLPNAIAYHKFGGEKDASYYNKRFIHYNGCRNYICMLLKNLNFKRLYIVGINSFIWGIVGCGFILRNRQVSLWIFQGIWYNIRNFAYIMRKRANIQRRVDENKFFYKAGWRYYWGRLKDYWTNQLHRRAE